MIYLIPIYSTAFAIFVYTHLDWYNRLIEPLPDIVKKPLGDCVKCFSGQISLWWTLISISTIGSKGFSIDLENIYLLVFNPSLAIALGLLFMIYWENE